MDKNQLIPKLQREYQVQRSSDTWYHIKDGLSMQVETHARVYPYGVKDDWVHITFHSKSSGEIKDGPVHDLLKEKYFKPEMVQW